MVAVLEQLAPPYYQESYDNAGLITGTNLTECTGVICTLDATEQVVFEAIQKGCNLIVAHHPIVFSGLKKITGKTYVERAIITAIRNNIAIYAIHTNLDNIPSAVNGKMANKLQLINRKVLLPKQNTLMKLVVFVPVFAAEKVREAIFDAGGGTIGKYNECSFSAKGTMTFTPGEGTHPHTGEIGKREISAEERVEIIFPAYLKEKLIKAMIEAHPYEEVAHDIIALQNNFTEIGSGLIGELQAPMETNKFLRFVKQQFGLQVIRHTALIKNEVKKIALCGGAGSFLIKNALLAGADVYITADVKYHEFFDAEDELLIADIGHWESEQYTIELLHDVLSTNFTTFAVLKSEVKTNPVQYFID